MNHRMLFKIAARNVFLHRMRTLVVGVILIFGAFLAVLGNAFVDGVSDGMKNSTTQSITGDIQVYSDSAKEKLSVFGNMDGSAPDVGYVENFQKAASALAQNANVSAVVPMGTSFAQISTGNLLDHFLEKLRKSYLQKNIPAQDLVSQKQRLQFLIQEIQKNLEGKFEEIGMLSAEDVVQAKQNLALVTGEAFWRNFDIQFESKIEFLANKIAPLIFDDNMIFFSYIGTDPQLFQANFPQFEIVKGQMIPPGTRGFLFHDYFYENFVKHRIARRLDQIQKKMKEAKTNLTDSKELQDLLKANMDQAAEIYLQLGPSETADLTQKLQRLLQSTETDFRLLIKNYLNMQDANFQSRYEFFYKEIAPHVLLYRVQIGDILPLNAFTKAGSSTSINIPVFGTFRFKSFENSPLAGNFSLMDLISFRELYGFVTEERRAQNKELEAEMNLQEVGRDSVEDLFAQGQPVKSKANAFKNVELKFKKKVIANNYQQEELNQGVFLNAAVLLKDPSQVKQTLTELNALSKKLSLGLQAVPWQEAAGFIGQMTFIIKVLLNIFIGIALLLAGLMITNSLLMAAMNRKQEIGTMRAIGAHSSFIYRLFFYETLIISTLFGGIGVLLGALAVGIIGKIGIPAAGDVATFFFSGPRLYLHLNVSVILIVMMIMVVIAVIATQYPAWKAMQVSPLQAMQKRE